MVRASCLRGRRYGIGAMTSIRWLHSSFDLAILFSVMVLIVVDEEG